MAKNVRCREDINDNVKIWSENTQRQRGDSILSRPESQFSGYIHLHIKQNDTRELADIWNQWSHEKRQMVYKIYGDIAYLLQVHVDKDLLRAMALFWNPLYNCFTFNREDLTPTVEEYASLLHLRKLDYTYILYRCGVFDWVPLLGLWGATGYAPLLVSRQYGSRQFVPATRGLGLCEFVFEGDKNKKKIVEIANAWLYPYQAKLAAPKLTVDYEIWRTKRKNCKIPSPSRGKALTLEEQFKVIPTEVEIVRQECEEEKRALNKRIAELEARNQELDHRVTYYQGQSDMFEKELNRVNVDFKDLKGICHNLEIKIKNSGLRKTPEEWEAGLRDRENDTKRYIKMLRTKEEQVGELSAHLQAARQVNETVSRDLMASHAQNLELQEQLTMLQEILQVHQQQNLAAELENAQSENETLKEFIAALKDALQQHKDLIDELQESMKMNDDNWDLQLQFARGDIKVREELMGEALIQIRRVAESVTSLAKEAERLKFWINPSTHFAKEWMEFLRRFKQLGERARPYRRVWF
ncbi:hypothetical protein GQ457_04G027510 [Hibiscus cannabinus]